MTQRDDRASGGGITVATLSTGQQSWASGETAAIEVTLPNANGRCEQIAVTVNDNTGNRTLTVTLTDENSAQVYTKAAIPENATTVYNANKGTPDFPAFLMNGPITVSLTPSGDPGASGMTATADFYVR